MNFAHSTLLIAFLAASFPSTASPLNSMWFNSGMNNRDITFSPDGDVLLTTIVAPRQQAAIIAVSYKYDDIWSPLKVAPFSGEFMDIEPAFSPDGAYVYFASKRPKPDRAGEDWDLWRVAFDVPDWGEPEHLGNVVNSEGNEFYPSLTREGKLYFTATREDSLGTEDIYRALPDENGLFKSVENVGAPVNSPAFEFNAFIAPDESYLIFGAQRRPDEIGGGDLYISYREEKLFTEPLLLSAPVNTGRLDYCPTVWQDRLYFTTESQSDTLVKNIVDMEKLYLSPGNGLGDVYWISLEEILP